MRTLEPFTGKRKESTGKTRPYWSILRALTRILATTVGKSAGKSPTEYSGPRRLSHYMETGYIGLRYNTWLLQGKFETLHDIQ